MQRVVPAFVVLIALLCIVQTAIAAAEKAPDNRVLALKLQKNISLDDLIKIAGYSISDEDVVLFLTAFMDLNPSIKSVSTLKKGALVRVPVRHLKKMTDRPAPLREIAERTRPKQYVARKRAPVSLVSPVALKIDKSILLKNIQKLFSSLGEDISLEKEGFKYFSLSEKSDISFDTGQFPIMDLHNDRVLVIDYSDTFPDEMKNLLEISWPEYRVVSPRGRSDLRSIVPLLLQESGYLFQESSKMISGGSAQVEYYSDFLVHGRNGKPMESDISLVSVLDSSEYPTPQEIISWFTDRDIRIIELSEHERKYINRSPGSVHDMHDNAQGRAFVESVLTLMGYPFSRDVNIELSPKKEITFSMRADLLVDMGYKKKVIEFSGVTNQERNYIQKLGIDIAQIEPWEGKSDAIKKIMSLLLPDYTNTPKRNAPSLSPRNTRYRLFVPGFVVKSLRGVFFITDTNLDEELRKNILGEGISVVTF